MDSNRLKCWPGCADEAEQVKHEHVNLQVDSALIEQLRAGYRQLTSKGAISLARGHARDPTPQREATS